MFTARRLLARSSHLFLAAMLALSSALLGAHSVRAATEPADFVLLDGRVHTLDAQDTVVEALAVRNERLVYVGTSAGAQGFIGPSTRVYRAGGRTVIPGINETHLHPLGAAQGEVTQAFVQLNSIAEIQQWVREQVSKTAADVWIRLPRVDVTRIAERRMPNRADLDAAAPDRPVVFIWQYANRQVQILNSAALRAAGITPQTEAPKGGRIVLDAAGQLTGVLEDAGALTAKFMPSKKPTVEQTLGSLERLIHAYNRTGITSITDRGSSVDGMRTYQRLREQKRLTARTTVTIRVPAHDSVETAKKTIAALPIKPREGDDWVKVGPLKFSIDGGVLYGTAYLREPYGAQAFGLYGLSDPSYRGLLQVDAERVRATIRAGNMLGWQMSTHVTGDAGVDIALDAVEAAAADAPISERRFTLIHAYFPTLDGAARAAKLGVCVDTQTAWFYKDGDALADALGQSRIETFIGVNRWRKAGVHVALNSDHMQGFDPDSSLNPYNPFLTMYAAVSRRTEGGKVIGADQRVSRTDALRMMTQDAAWLHFDDEKKGTLEVGKLGDLAVLTDDYFVCDEAKIPALRALLTVVGGLVVYDADEKSNDAAAAGPKADPKVAWARVPERMQKFVDEGQIAGAVMLVAQRGKVVHLSPVGVSDLETRAPMKTDALFAVASMTKPITATAIMMLSEEGKLAIDDAASKYIPEFKDVKLAAGPPQREITIRDLLTHTSGLSGDQQNLGTLAETASKMAGRTLAFEPGNAWKYGPGLTICGRIVEVVSGQPYENYLADKIFKPLGMTDTTFFPTKDQQSRIAKLYERDETSGKLQPTTHWLTDLSPGRTANPSGGLFSTATDMGRFYQAILNGGALDGSPIVSRFGIAEMTSIQTGDLKAGFVPGCGWGLGWCVVREPQGVARMLSPGTYGHGGAFGTQGWVDPQRQMIFVMLLQRAKMNSDGSPMREAFQAAAVEAAEQLDK
ncbi:MAG: amidohydrolase family protein [Planctomycetes bacterium]|nr:amidohydrolase family protein [Planctomycetota bacterium]